MQLLTPYNFGPKDFGRDTQGRSRFAGDLCIVNPTDVSDAGDSMRGNLRVGGEQFGLKSCYGYNIIGLIIC